MKKMFTDGFSNEIIFGESIKTYWTILFLYEIMILWFCYHLCHFNLSKILLLQKLILLVPMSIYSGFLSDLLTL